MNTIIRSPRGTARRAVKIESIQIPDLWHLAMWLKDNEATVSKAIGHNHLGGQKWSDAVLETWHLCHDLLDNCRADGKL